MIRTLIFLFASTLAVSLAAANPYSSYTHYDWDTTINLAQLTDKELADNAIILVDTRMMEYVKR